MSRCPTTSGSYQCERDAGHEGPCETQTREYATTSLERRVAVLEAQVKSLQLAAPKGLAG